MSNKPSQQRLNFKVGNLAQVDKIIEEDLGANDKSPNKSPNLQKRKPWGPPQAAGPFRV